jgi:hypothetical protein
MGGKVFKGITKGIGNVVKTALPLAAAGAGMYFGGPAGSALAGSLFGGGEGGGSGIAGGLIDYFGNTGTAKDARNAYLGGNEAAAQYYSPYYGTGVSANQQLADRASRGFQFNQADLYNDPGYQFQFEQGQRGLNAQLGRSGLLGSGRALKEATQFGQGLAERQFNDVYNRNLDRWGKENATLSALSDAGFNAAGGMAPIAQDTGQTNAYYNVAQGNAKTDLYGNLLQNVPKIANEAINYFSKAKKNTGGGSFGSMFGKALNSGGGTNWKVW